MKVLFIHCRYKLPGGEDGVVSAEVELLRSNGIDVQLLSFSNDGGTLLKILQLPFNFSAYIKTRRVLRAFKPDIIHIHNLHFAASTSVFYAIRSQEIPFVITLHNFRLLCPSGTLYYNGHPYLNSIHKSFPWASIKDGVYNHSRFLTFWVGFSTWLNRVIGTYKMANRYIVLTGHAKSIFVNSSLRVDHNKIIIKPNFVSDPFLQHRSRKDNFLFIGRLSEEKGIKVLLEAFKQVPLTLTIIGEGPLREQVEAACREHSNITYLGYQQKDVIINELRTCNALIFPSVWYETFGLTIIEAFATSTPVIASNIGSPSLLIKDQYNGLHFEESNAGNLQKKLLQWQSFDDGRKQEFSAHARKSYEQFYTPQRNLAQMLSIYTSVINEKKRVVGT
jgi:glycosyltransferase involved in cell wall biosynthesis